MRFGWLVSGLVALVGCKAYHQPLPPRTMAVKGTTLQYPSGLRVLFEQHPGSGRVPMALLVGAGSANDPPGREGAAHLVEHLAYRSRPAGRLSMWDELDFAGVASSGGAPANAFTTFDSTVFSGITPADRVGSVLPLMASLVVQPLLGIDPAVLELERSVVHNEHHQRNPHGGGEILAAVALAVLGPGVSGTRPISGTAASIAAITRPDLEQFVATHYRPRAVTVVLVGDLEPEAIDALVRRSFPAGWLTAGSVGAVQPFRLEREAEDTPGPPPAPKDRPIVEAAVGERLLIFSWAVPGTTLPGGSAMPLVAESMRDTLWRVGRDQGVRAVSATVIPGPVTSILMLTAQLKPEAKPDLVSAEFRRHTDFGWFSFAEWRDLSLSQLYDEQNLLHHAESRARTVFATGSTKPPKLGADLDSRLALDRLSRVTLLWPRAREVLVAPLVKTNVALDGPPPTLEPAARRIVVQPEMIQSVALPPPLPEVKRFTLSNGLLVVLSRRAPVPLVTVTLGLPAGARHTTRAVTELLEFVLEWEPENVHMARAGRPDVQVRPDSTLLQLNGAAWNLPVLLDVLGHNLSPRVGWRRVMRFGDVIERILERKERLEDDGTSKRKALVRQVMPTGSANLNVSVEEGKGLSRGEFVDFVELAFRPNGAALVIDGDFDLVSTEALVRELFTDWRPSKDTLPPLRALGPPPQRQAKPVVIEAQESLVTQVRLMCRLPPAVTLEQRGAVALLERALALYFEDDLRQLRGLTYGVATSATGFRNEDNLLWLSATLDPRGKQAALERFVQRLDELEGSVWDEQLVDVARWRVAKGFVGSVATSPAVSRLLAGELATGASWDDTLALPSRLATTPLRWVDEVWAACADSLALEVEGERSSIEAVLKRRPKK